MCSVPFVVGAQAGVRVSHTWINCRLSRVVEMFCGGIRAGTNARADEGDRMDDRQEVPSLPSNTTSSSSSAFLAGTKRSVEQDAEDLR